MSAKWTKTQKRVWLKTISNLQEIGSRVPGAAYCCAWSKLWFQCLHMFAVFHLMLLCYLDLMSSLALATSDCICCFRSSSCFFLKSSLASAWHELGKCWTTPAFFITIHVRFTNFDSIWQAWSLSSNTTSNALQRSRAFRFNHQTRK